MSNTITVHPIEQKKNLSEIYQSMDIKFSILEKMDDFNYKQISTPVKCVDFICDSYTATKQKAKFAIYGYSWNGEQNPLSFDEVRLYLEFPDKKSYENFISQLSIIHKIENDNKIPNTQVFTLDKNKAIVLGNNSWLSNCLTLRLYLFLLRIIAYPYKNINNWLEELREKNVSDGKYAKSMRMSSWNRILSDLNSIKDTGRFCGLNFKGGTSRLHHNAGIFSVLGSHSEINPQTVHKNKHYQVLKERGFEMVN